MHFKHHVWHVATLIMLVSTLWTPMICKAQTIETPTDSEFKSYMDYRTITSVSSRQYKLQSMCETNENGLRTYNGYYTVAVGSGFGVTVGDYIDVQLSTGNVLHCIVGDMKQDAHTDAANIQAHNGNIVEFIVDIWQLDSDARSSGDISDIEGFGGYVASVRTQGSAVFNNEVAEEPEPIVLRTEYLVLAKSSVPLQDTNTLYSVDYMFDGMYSSIICTKEFYDSVQVGDVLSALE